MGQRQQVRMLRRAETRKVMLLGLRSMGVEYKRGQHEEPREGDNVHGEQRYSFRKVQDLSRRQRRRAVCCSIFFTEYSTHLRRLAAPKLKSRAYLPGTSQEHIDVS